MRSPAGQRPARTTSVARFMSEQEVALRHGQRLGGLAGQKLAVRPPLISLGIDLDLGTKRIVDHILLADLASALHRQHRAAKSPFLANALGERGLRDEQ